MKISAFLSEKLGLPVSPQTQTAFDRLAGKKINNATFYIDMAEVENWCLPWMPLYVLPIAKEGFYWIGLHLTPENVAAKRLPVVQVDDSSIYDYVKIVEVASSLKDYLRRVMVHWEAELDEDCLEPNIKPEARNLENEEMGESLQLLRELFGADFYTPGQRAFYTATHEDEDQAEFFFDDPQAIMIDEFGGTPGDYADQIWYTDDEAALLKTRLLTEACQKFPDSLTLQMARAEFYYKQGNPDVASKALNEALQCYHHTAYHYSPQKMYDLGRELLTQTPTNFGPLAVAVLTERSNIDRFKWVVSFIEAGQIERTIKHLHDLCFDWGHFDTSYILDFFKHLYQQVGWDWAVHLCDLHYLPENTRPSGQGSAEQTAFWEQLLSQYLNLE